MASASPRIDMGISEGDRAVIAHGLGRLLADTHRLCLTARNFHWNVTGPSFPALHALFLQQSAQLWDATDPIAERIRALGHPAPASYAEFDKLASVPDAPAVAPPAKAMARILVDGHAAAARTARALLPTAQASGDAPTTGLLARRLEEHENAAWILRNLLED